MSEAPRSSTPEASLPKQYPTLRWKAVAGSGERKGSRKLDTLRSSRRKECEATTVVPGDPRPAISNDPLLVRLCHVLESTKGTGRDIRSISEYLGSVPERIGRSKALDAAIDCLLVFHQDASIPHPGLEAKRAHSYMLALAALNASIEQSSAGHPDPETEMLCAASILCSVEVRLNPLLSGRRDTDGSSCLTTLSTADSQLGLRMPAGRLPC